MTIATGKTVDGLPGYLPKSPPICKYCTNPQVAREMYFVYFHALFCNTFRLHGIQFVYTQEK